MEEIPWTLIFIVAAIVVSLIIILGCVCCVCCRKRNIETQSGETNRGNIKYQKVPTSNTLDLHGESVKSARSRVEKFPNEKKQVPTSNILDLHGQSVKSARSLVEKFLYKKKQEQRWSGHGQTLSIITGKGNHSLDGRAVLKPVVEKQLRQNSYKYTVDPKNAGRIIVKLDYYNMV